MKVYVINRNGHPLMPCTPAKARKLLRDGKARAAGCYPFTIQLLWDCEEHVQDVTLGIDKGSKITGIACVCRGEVLLAAEVYHRLDVKEKLDALASGTVRRESRIAHRADAVGACRPRLRRM